LEFAKLGGVLFEIGIVHLGERVYVLFAAFARHSVVVQSQELVKEATFQQDVLGYLIVGHRLAELVNLLQDELSYATDCFYFELVENIVNVVEALDLIGRFLV
jgi:hypothetical protein